MNRRHFLMAAAVASTAARPSALASPNDTIRVACVGFHGQGQVHINNYLKIPNVEIAALCDVDDAVMAKGMKMVEAAGKKRPTAYADLRKLLEDKSIDAISIATPNFHHTLQTVWACQAGKDVYVEKPCSYNMFEAKQIVAASRKYNRIVQHGTNGGSQAIDEAVDKLREGVIGDVYMARGVVFNWRDTIGRAVEEPVPSGVHYDLWMGPAPDKPFTKNRFHYNWHWQWDYGNGDIGNQGIHQMHAARRGLGVKYPTKISAIGGHFMFDDDQQTPNVLSSVFEFNEGGKKKMLEFEVRHWISNHEAGIGEAAVGRRAETNTVGDIFYGSKGYLAIGRGGFQTFLGKEQAPGPKNERPAGNLFANFLDVMRSRKRSDQIAEIEEGAISTMLVHLANISYRLGRTLYFDPETYTCKGDAEANAMFTRTRYRAPYVVPKLA